MASMPSDHLAKEAERLKNDPIFIKALEGIRADALNELATANADDKTNIIRLQQVAGVVNEIRAVLDRYILQGGQELAEDASPYA